MSSRTSSRVARKSQQRLGCWARQFECLEDRRLLAWLGQIGGADTETVRDSAVDSDGSTYIGGTIFGTTDFDPGPGVFNLTASGDRDAYVAKYDANGNFAWALGFGGTRSLDSAWGITVDATGTYVTGTCDASSDFNGDGIPDLAGKGTQVFILKLNSANGAMLWVKGVGARESRDIAVADGHVYITGDFNGTVDFNPGPATNNLTVTGGKRGETDPYVLKLNTATGNYEAAWNFGSAGTDWGRRVMADANNVYVAGMFSGTADFDPSANAVKRTSLSDYDTYFASYTASGELNWVQSIDISFADGFAVDETHVYLGNSFTGVVDIDPSSAVLNVNSAQGSEFIARYSKTTGLLDPSFTPKQFGGGGAANVFDKQLYLDAAGAMYIYARYSGAVDVDPGAGVVLTTAEANRYLLKLDAAGNYVIHWQFTNANPRSVGIVGETIYVAGTFESTATFPNGESLTSRGGTDGQSASDIFVVSLDQPTTTSTGLSTAVAGNTNPYTFARDSRSISLLDSVSVQQLFAESESTWTRKLRVSHRV